MAKVLISICAALSLLLSWMIPHHYTPWVTGYSEFAAFFGAFCTSLLLFNKPIVIPRAALFIAVTAIIPLVQWLFGLIYFVGDALIVSLYLLGLATMVLVGFNLARDPLLRSRVYPVLASLFITAAVLSTWIACRQWLFLVTVMDTFEAAVPVNSGYRPFANFGQPNNLATLLCMAIASIWYLYETRRLNQIAASALLAFILFGVVLTQSRTPWVGALFVLLWWVWKARRVTTRLSTSALVAWVAIYAAGIFALPALTHALDLSGVDLVEHAQSTERLALWNQFIRAVVHGPLWGYGWNQVSVAQVEISSIYPVAIMTNSSHNVLLDLLVWNGPILGGLFILVVGAWIIRLGVFSRTQSSHFAMLAVSFALIHAMLEYPLEYAYFLLPVGLLLGLMDGEQHHRLGAALPRLARLKPVPRVAMLSLVYTRLAARVSSARMIELITSHLVVPRAAFAGFLVVAFAFMLWIGQEYRVLNQDYRTHTNKKTGDLPSQHTILLTQLRDRLSLQLTDPAGQMSTAQLDLARKVAYRYPQVGLLYRYAADLSLNHQHGQAQSELSTLHSLYGPAVYRNALHSLILLETEQQPISQQISNKIQGINRNCKHHKHRC